MLPARNDKTFSRPLLVLATSDPHNGQNILVMVLPLSAVCVYRLSSPLMFTRSSGTITFVPNTAPVDRRQSSQWQLMVTIGSSCEV